MFESSNRRSFQRGLDCDKARASRRDAQLSLRRKQREAHLQKKVRLNRCSKPRFYDERETEITASPSSLSKYVANIMQTDNIELQLIGLTAIRQILSVERDPPTQRVLCSGSVPKIVQFMFSTDNDRNNGIRNKIKFESAWIITNIAASTSDCTRKVCQYGAIDGFVDLLRNAVEPEMADQAIWGLGNIAGDSKDLRDCIVKTGVMNDLVLSLPNWRSDMQENAIWAISNIFRYSHQLKLTEINNVVPAICNLLRETKEENIIKDCLWALYYLSNQSETICYYLVEKGIINDCMKLLHQEIGKYHIALNQIGKSRQKQLFNDNAKSIGIPRNITKEAMLKMNCNIYQPCLRFIGNILSGSDELTQSVLDCGYLDIIEPFAFHFVAAQRKETIWALSNICAGSHHQIEFILSRPNLLRAIMDAANNDKLSVRKEACWCICNLTADAITSQIKLLADGGAIEALCCMLDPKWPLSDNHISCIVEGLEAFLKIYGSSRSHETYNPYAIQIEECHGLDYLEERITDTNIHEDTFNAMVDLIETFWGRDDNEIKCDLLLNQKLNANIDTNTNQFKFGTNGGNIENNQNIGNQFGENNNNNNNNIRFQF